MSRSLLVVMLAAASVVAGIAQRSLGSGSVVASVTITSPSDGSSVVGYNTVQARAQGPPGDPPARVRFFVDHHSRPVSTDDCVIDPSTSACGVQWQWDTTKLVGPHTLTAVVVLVDGQTSAQSDPVHVTVVSPTRIKAHRAKHPVAGRMMALSGRVISLSRGRPGARHVPVTLEMQTALGKTKTLHARTNRHGYYRKRIRAGTNSSIRVTTDSTHTYQASNAPVEYEQYVRGAPRCQLSSHHARPKHLVAMRCQFKHFQAVWKFYIEGRVHGKWVRGRGFTTNQTGHTKLYVGARKRGTFVFRELFPRSSFYDRSTSNAVRLHVG